MDPAEFVRGNTEIKAPPLVPEICLHLATEVTPIWQATEESLARGPTPPPFWAFAWAGGQALARYLLDNPGVVAGREVLESRFGELESQYAEGEVPRPPNWGGYRLIPASIEFWQGRPNRLHDRLRYSRRETGGWLIERLAP